MQSERTTNGRVLARVARRDYVGHDDLLERVRTLAGGTDFASNVVLSVEPGAGCTEFLLQTYDLLFLQPDTVVPIYFHPSPRDASVAARARSFLYSALVQYVAYRRNNPGLCRAILSSSDLVELALPADAEWIERQLAAVDREQNLNDEKSFVRACLGVLRKIRDAGLRPHLLIDDSYVYEDLNKSAAFSTELAYAAISSGARFVFGSLRRVVGDLFSDATDIMSTSVHLKLERLSTTDAWTVVEHAAQRYGVKLNDQTRELIAQEFTYLPSHITASMHAAAEHGVSLTSFRECQQLYVDEIMGGRINRIYDAIVDRVCSVTNCRRYLIRTLFESRLIDSGRIAIDALMRRLEVTTSEITRIVRMLNAYELVSYSSNIVEVNGDLPTWTDFLHTEYRLEVAAEPRALVFADTLLEVLKRAPQAMARRYRREAALGLKDTLGKFNCHRIPATLFHYDHFRQAYRGADDSEIQEGLDSESELIRLPQIVHVANCGAFDPTMLHHCDEERCAVGHGFEAGSYADTNEIIWIAAELESKLEAGRSLVETWCDRLQASSRACGFTRVKFWLVASEGFSDDAIRVLNDRQVYNSSRQQFELIASRVSLDITDRKESKVLDEFEMIIPMGDDAELIAANTVEQIARKINFNSEAINQIKTALVEACINAAEHSLSPDRKIYQRFRLENDKLTVTVSSRGVVPVTVNGNSEPSTAAESKGRRGWGLKLIQTLMDEVEFETVDDGTRLRMTKLLR
jgi:serine/threonine-protein kinase RsbW